MDGVCSHVITLHRRGSGFVLRVDYARWGQTPEDLRHLALSAPHARTRERALALFDITQHSCATQVAGRTGRRAPTVLGWVPAYNQGGPAGGGGRGAGRPPAGGGGAPAYNQGGPDALTFRRTGGRRPFFAHSAKPSSARWSARPSARRPPHPEKGPIPRRAGRCAAWSAGGASASACCAVARRSAWSCPAASCRGRKPRSCWAGPTRSSDKRSSSSSRACWRAPNAIDICWSMWMRRTSTRTHQDADLGYGWAERGQRLWVASSSPGLSARVSFYGLYLYNEGQVRLWPYPRANGDHTIEVLRRLRAAFPDEALIVLWDGAPYHRAQAVREIARTLDIELMPLQGYSPDLMPVEALWHWLREDVTYHHCHASAEDLTRRAADFEARINQDPCALADRLWVKDCLDPDEEKLRFSN